MKKKTCKQSSVHRYGCHYAGCCGGVATQEALTVIGGHGGGRRWHDPGNEHVCRRRYGPFTLDILGAPRIYNEEKEELTIFAVNRNINEDVEMITDVRGMEGYRLLEHIVLENSDMKLVNAAGKENVYPKSVQQSVLDGGMMTSTLHKASWNVIRLGK